MKGIGAGTMRNRGSSRAGRRGGVLIATLVLVMSVGAISVCLLELDSSRMRRQVASIDNKRAFNLAEAGLAEAYFGVSTGRTGNVGTVDAPARFGDGLFWVEATELDDDLVGLESTGMAGTGRATLSLVVRRAPQSVAALGVLGAQQVSIGGSAVLDSYDSREDGSASSFAPLRSNGDIALGMLAKVKGDATPGPNGTVRFGLLSSVTGSTAPAPEAIEMPEIELPLIEPGEDIDHSGATPLVLAEAEAAHGTLRVRTGAKVVLRGPAQVVVERLIVQGGGVLEIDDSAGPVELFVTDWLDLDPESTVRVPSAKPTGLSLLVAATGTRDRDGDGIVDPPVDFRCRSPFHGTLYAPNAPLTLASQFHVYGTVAAQRLAVGTSAAIHFDEALIAAAKSSADAAEVMSWRIVEIPDAVARDLATDPFAALAVDAASLPRPAEAHEPIDYFVTITYVDLLLFRKTYRGPESGFDWSGVKLVLSLVRSIL
jgi:hypothetical protein